MVIRPDKRAEILTRRVLEGRERRVLHLAGGILSAQSTISAISTANGSFEPEIGDEWRVPMVENQPTSGPIHHFDPPITRSATGENGPDGGNGGNGGNGGKRTGNTPTEKVAIEL